VSTFIVRFPTSGTGVRLAVKDLIDMAGVPTTAGCRAVADAARPAAADAACLAGARAGDARIVGRTNLHELALGVTGINPWFGTPVNPQDPNRVPGGSSSGSGVAVAAGEADIAYGTDTGGSIRIPAACCGVAGLKTTWGRISVDGVWPLSPTFDSVGPMGRDVTALIDGMTLLEPGFQASRAVPGRVGRMRVDADPRINRAVDQALKATGWDVVDVDVAGWQAATEAAALLLVAEAWATDRSLVENHGDKVGADVVARLRSGAAVDATARARAEAVRARWRTELAGILEQVDVLVTPTLTIFPPTLADAAELLAGRCTLPVNLAGVPALAVPVPADGPLPASLQLIGRDNAENDLLAAGLILEDAVSSLGRN
jgi:amidase